MIGGWELILIAVGLACMAFWIWMIVDCAIYERATGTKIGWLLIILLVGFLGAPLYYIVRKLPRYFGASTSKSNDAPIA
jgi:hypothetical protein